MSKENKTNKIKNNGSLDFVHRFIPASVTMTKNNKNKSPVLLLLHGTGGSEDDLIPIGKMLCEDCALLSPRGKVTENGMPRFFRRLAEGIFDTEDLLYRTQELADFVKNASRFYGFDLNKVIVVGFSNGANIAASMILLRPEVVSGAILLELWFHLNLNHFQIYRTNSYFCQRDCMILLYPNRRLKGYLPSSRNLAQS